MNPSGLRLRKSQSWVENTANIPRSLSYKFLGDAVDGLRYDTRHYDPANERMLCIVGSSIQSNSSSSSGGLGFRLTSQSALRGHFVEKVAKASPAFKAGLRGGEMVVAANGVDVIDMMHDELVHLLRQAVLRQGQLDLVVIPCTPETPRVGKQSNDDVNAFFFNPDDHDD